MSSVVVLLGPPGSGKSTVGEILGTRGFRWREWEPWILEQWGSRDAFVAAKAEALPILHQEIRSWIEEGGGTAVIESTGLSDSSFLDELDGISFVVRLDVSEPVALARVERRQRGRHLSDDLAANALVWQAFRDRVVPNRRCDLVLDTEASSAAHVAAEVSAALTC